MKAAALRRAFIPSACADQIVSSNWTDDNFFSIDTFHSAAVAGGDYEAEKERHRWAFIGSFPSLI